MINIPKQHKSQVLYYHRRTATHLRDSHQRTVLDGSSRSCTNITEEATGISPSTFRPGAPHVGLNAFLIYSIGGLRLALVRYRIRAPTERRPARCFANIKGRRVDPASIDTVDPEPTCIRTLGWWPERNYISSATELLSEALIVLFFTVIFCYLMSAF